MPRVAKKTTDTENKAAVSAAEVPAKKTAAKKTAAKKAEVPEVKEEVKTEEVKAEAVKEDETKKAASKKAAAKTAEPETTVTIQFQGKDIVAAQIVEKAKEAFAQISPDVRIASLDVYVKPEEGVAYYAVNGEGSGDFKIEL